MRMIYQGKFKMQAHVSSGVVMYIAAFKVSHSVDVDATTLPRKRARNVPAGFVRREATGYNLCGQEPMDETSQTV